jgi:hypothetical protein
MDNMRWILPSGARRLGIVGVIGSVLLLGLAASPSVAAPVSFGAKLTAHTQPFGKQSCHQQIPGAVPAGGVCTWVAQVAFENGSHYTAPKNGTVHTLKLVSCDAGSFTLQLVKKNSAGKYQLVRNGPTIHYAADPRGATKCKEDVHSYVVQSFPISVPVVKGEYIAVKTAVNGLLHCSGDDMPLYYPALSTGGFRHETGGTGCALLVSLTY